MGSSSARGRQCSDPDVEGFTAAGEGSAAAIAINNDLVDQDLSIAVANLRLGLPV